MLSYKEIINNDFTIQPPLLIVKNKNGYRQLDLANYTQVLSRTLNGHHIVYENGCLKSIGGDDE